MGTIEVEMSAVIYPSYAYPSLDSDMPTCEDLNVRYRWGDLKWPWEKLWNMGT